MKKIYTVFLIFTLLFLLVQALIYFTVDLPDWVIFYLNDFLVMPLVLTICLVVVRKIRKEPSIRLSLFTVLSLATLYSVYFEVFLPEVTVRYTADPVDVLLYFAGATLFFFLQEPATTQADKEAS